MREMDSPGSHPPRTGGQSPVALPVRETSESSSPEGTWRFTAPAQDSAVPQLRHAVRDLVRRRGVVPEDTLGNLLLILSELATNAVQHAALLSPEIGVEVSLQRGWLRVAVEDGHPYRPKALDAEPEHELLHGRGLLLVKTVTQEAGGLCDVEQTGTGGKIIWAALPLPRLPAAGLTSPLNRL